MYAELLMNDTPTRPFKDIHKALFKGYTKEKYTKPHAFLQSPVQRAGHASLNLLSVRGTIFFKLLATLREDGEPR